MSPSFQSLLGDEMKGGETGPVESPRVSGPLLLSLPHLGLLQARGLTEGVWPKPTGRPKCWSQERTSGAPMQAAGSS